MTFKGFSEKKTAFISSSIKTALAKGVGLFAGVMVSILVANLLGAEGLGLINIANQLTNLLLMVALLGVPTAALKEASISFSNNDFQRLKDIFTSAIKIVLLSSILLSAIGIISVSFFVEKYFDKKLEIPLVIFLTFLSLHALVRLHGAILIGINKVWQGQLAENVITLSMVLLGILVLILFDIQLSITRVALLYALGTAIAAIILLRIWHFLIGTTLPSKHKKTVTSTLLKTGLPLLFVQGVAALTNSIDVLMLGSLIDSSAVGIYGVAFRIAFLTSILLVITNSVISPRIAALYANRNISALESEVRAVTAYLSIASIFTFVLILFFGKAMLGIWGEEFDAAYTPLVILSFAQLANISCGCVGLIMSLCNQQRTWSLACLASLLFNIILNYILIPRWGVGGAAVATGASMIALNFSGVVLVKKTVGVLTLPDFRKVL